MSQRLTLPGQESHHGEVVVQDCTITVLFVESLYRFQGKGTRLLKLGEEALRDQGCKTVCLYSTNTSRPFYIKQGYSMAHPESWYILQKNLV